MFSRYARYPTPVASNDDEGIRAPIAWVVERAQPGDTISVWTHLKSNRRAAEKDA